MYYHSQNLKKEDHDNTWFNRRCWIGDEPQLHFQLVAPGKGISFTIELNHYGDTAIGGRIGLFFFTLYWGIDWRPLYRLLEKFTRRRDQKYTNGRTMGFSIDSQCMYLELWNDPMEHRGRDPKWWRMSTYWHDITGRPKYHEKTLEEREVMIPMPEKSYPATAILKLVWWSRPFLPTKFMKRVEIKIPEGIPFPGKGENSWDCGDDAAYGMTTESNSIAFGVGKLVGSVLHDRIRYGGWDNYKWDKPQINEDKKPMEDSAQTANSTLRVQEA